jgi:hypothetical protein
MIYEDMTNKVDETQPRNLGIYDMRCRLLDLAMAGTGTEIFGCLNSGEVESRQDRSGLIFIFSIVFANQDFLMELLSW